MLPRRQFERYVALVPWKVLGGVGSVEKASPTDPDAGTPPPPCRRGPRRAFEDTAAARHTDARTVARLRNGARLAAEHANDDGGFLAKSKLGRVRSSVVDAPMAQWCKITLAMKQPHEGVATYLAVARVHGLARRSVLRTEGGRLSRGDRSTISR